MESSIHLPIGWTITTIEELIKNDGIFVDGDWVVSDSQDPMGDVRLIQLADVGDGIYRDRSNRFLTHEKALELGCTFLEGGDLLIARMPDPLGRACIFPGDLKTSVTVVDVCIVRTGKGGTNHRWLMYAINSPQFRAMIESFQSGSTRKRISRKNLAKIKFPLPPLPEQERIVERIESLFTQRDAGVAGLKRAQLALKRYRASVLKAACEGRLVPQDPDDEPVEDFLKNILGENYAKEIALPNSSEIPYMPPGWAYGRLDKLIYVAGRIGWRGLRADEYTKEGPLFLSVYNLNKGGDYVDFSDSYHISQQRYDESPEIKLRENDIVLVKDGAGIGKIGVIRGLPEEATINSSLLLIRAGEMFLPKFLFYLLKGPQMQEIVRARITGSATPHLFQRDIKRFKLLIPPLSEQQRIVTEVESRLSVVQELEQAVSGNLKRASRLRQAILKRAFEGKLVEQNSEDEQIQFPPPDLNSGRQLELFE